MAKYLIVQNGDIKICDGLEFELLMPTLVLSYRPYNKEWLPPGKWRVRIRRGWWVWERRDLE